MHQSIICDCELVFLQREWTQHMNWQHASNHQMPHLPYCFMVKKPFDSRKWILLTACISLKLSHYQAMSEKDEIQSRITWKWSKYCLMFDKGKVSTTGKTQNHKQKILVKQIQKTQQAKHRTTNRKSLWNKFKKLTAVKAPTSLLAQQAKHRTTNRNVLSNKFKKQLQLKHQPLSWHNTKPQTEISCLTNWKKQLQLKYQPLSWHNTEPQTEIPCLTN